MNKYQSRRRRGLKAKARINLTECARLVVYRSNSHIYSQIVIDDTKGNKVLAASSSIDKELKTQLVGKKKVDQSFMVGKLLGKRALENGVEKVAFDRAGYRYHGRVKALADGARDAGLNF
ncbi:50S ribosomal protein L18 [Legionella israelensis]|uniref:Large ribosomal subunit protein uL18 n=1 Tax=Legionella israelensis TaxID=454 RepID=A0A0W0VIR0_9GAMM|nr:50S ribosomal protein L18 [Legionella israelensis]KTD19999.1 50S ribosomal protein L18 [Legionella israelensis]QBS09927.1 50S ribosomal protein L18 [Legionella israelensis]SCY40532.1 LSU ribosomal protein L18P [Legionella israelensis DSM 19235]STX59490.1 50S ribosomal protein L18 [Legionella israelensis]